MIRNDPIKEEDKLPNATSGDVVTFPSCDELPPNSEETGVDLAATTTSEHHSDICVYRVVRQSFTSAHFLLPW